MFTKKEAKSKYCVKNDNIDPYSTKCVSSCCMAWVWNTEINKVIMDDDPDGEFIGRCGLVNYKI